MTLDPGARLGPYEVLALLGSGGMGEVYRARDPRLAREVAIKVLPGEIADPDRLRRFEQEARAASALSHPGILTVHDIGTHGGAPFVVSELLDGQTLRARLDGGPLPVRKAVEHTLEIGRGLAAAHEKGIVHRDLKPENVFLTRDGPVKILDFGLAKLRKSHEGPGGEARRSTASWETDPGSRMGTAGYMSPEQVRGQDVDHRSDIFSFGAVLYEMVSGRRAFRRDTAVETMSAILNEDPPSLSGTSRAVPPALERIVDRCLEKRPEDRFHSTHDLVLALEAASSGVSDPSPAAVPRERRRLPAGVLLAVAVLAAIAGLWLLWPRDPPPLPVSIQPATSYPGEEGDPALSHDGEHLAFVRAPEGIPNLYVTLVGVGEPLLLGRDATAPAWTPDDRQIAFVRHRQEGGDVADDIFLVPALGGQERRLATVSMGGSHALSFSPDGTLLALPHRTTPGDPIGIHLLSPETSTIRKLTQPPAGYFGDADPRFSPDGRTLAFTRVEALGVSDIYLVPVTGGDERRLTRGNHNTQGLTWAPDGQSLAFSAVRVGGGSPFALWRVAVTGGEPVRLEFGEHGMRPTASRDGGRLAYVRQELRWDIWRVGGPAAADGDREPARLISSTSVDYLPSYSPDGRAIAFASFRSGAQEVWICDADGSNPRQLTFLGSPLTGGAAWSPDGLQLTFNSPWEGSHDVYTVSRSGGPPRRLTTAPAIDRPGSWSPDGRWIYFHSNRTGRNEVWKVPAEGGDARQVTEQGGVQALASADGRFVYHLRHDVLEGRPGVWRTPVEGGEAAQVLDHGRALRWDLLEDGIVFLNEDGADPLSRDDAPEAPTLELFDFRTGETSRLAVLPNAAPWGFSVSPDRRWVVYTGWEPPEADIMVVEGFR